jgi:rhodanese-related sulfurtransferase
VLRSLRRALPFAVALAACAVPAHAESELVSPAELAARLGTEGAPLILDVRSPGEYASGHVPGALNIPHGELAARLGELGGEPAREMVVYCERGGRARAAEETLRRSGFRRVRHLEGDMQAWRQRRLPCTGC